MNCSAVSLGASLFFNGFDHFAGPSLRESLALAIKLL
jgi:hypothetical protein